MKASVTGYCRDGECLDSALVCDGNQHCSDWLDEMDCNMVEIPATYNSKAPPRLLGAGNTYHQTEVRADATLLDIIDINEPQSAISLLFSLKEAAFNNLLGLVVE